MPRDADGEVVPDPDYSRYDKWMFQVNLFVNGELKEFYGAPSEEAYKRLLIRLIKEYTRTQDDRIEVSIWNGQQERWINPSGKVMDAAWDGMLPAWNQVKVGSWNG